MPYLKAGKAILKQSQKLKSVTNIADSSPVIARTDTQVWVCMMKKNYRSCTTLHLLRSVINLADSNMIIARADTQVYVLHDYDDDDEKLPPMY